MEKTPEKKDLAKKIKNCKHAFLPQGKALKKGDIGVENASKEDIIEAINKARPEVIEANIIFTKDDLIRLGLVGGEDAREKRAKLGEQLGIGYSNGKQFLNRLNNFGVTRQEFIKAIEEIKNNGK